MYKLNGLVQMHHHQVRVEERHVETVRWPGYRNIWKLATAEFKRKFLDDEFGHKCDVCDRLWFMSQLKKVTPRIAIHLAESFPDENTANFRLCDNCFNVCRKLKMPNMSKTNGYKYPPKPMGLPKLDLMTERLISPRLPFMQIRRLRRDGGYSFLGQIINIPVDVDTMVKSLPRSLDDDYVINVNLKKNILHKSPYLRGHVNWSTIEKWLGFLVEQPLYKHYGITIDAAALRNLSRCDDDATVPDDSIEVINTNEASDAELLNARQHTMLWNEDHSLDIAPGQHRRPESLLFDRFAEELSFPEIYYGVGRQIQSPDGSSVRTTPYSMCTSEIRRSDRRGATPRHVLYMAMKILRFRVQDGIQKMYRCLRSTHSITRDMIEDREFVERLIDTNQAFLKTIPNSVQYWAARRKDLFAMIRQLGKPTAFLTMSANEMNWPTLLRILHRLSDEFKNLGADIVEEEIFQKLDRDKRAHLVAEDPVTCALYFNKLVRVIMSILSTKKSHNPFGRHRVIDYFLRIEFQHRGSPHAHILLWLDNDSGEDLSESMPRTVQLITDLCSVDKDDLPDAQMIRNQTHAHTFTCTKRGEKTCRFNIPFWPMERALPLLPLNKDDPKRERLKQKAADARIKLETKTYDSVQHFMNDIGCDHNQYLDLIRSSLTRPIVGARRDMTQILVNTFHPWIASVLNSNMDMQIILDAYSCAAYVVDYVNKANRGMSHLHRELTKIHEANPEYDQTQLMTRVGLKVLNSVEMSAQEAAWYLLRQKMSWASRTTVFIPTMQPHERYRARKKKSTMDAENISGDSSDIWVKSLIEKYEERPSSLETISLACFAAWYAPSKSGDEHADDASDDTEDADDTASSDEHEQGGQAYTKRTFSKIIKYRNYDKSDTINYKREMVTLHVPFRNELVDVIDRDKFLQIYETEERQIIEGRQMFEAKDFDAIMQEIELMRSENNEDNEANTAEQDTATSSSNAEPNNDDLQDFPQGLSVSAVKSRDNVLTKQQYCELMRKTNPEQREIVLEVIFRLHEADSEPIHAFLTGPAGCGKTFTLKALMETYNRYTEEHNSMNNAYIATATTGKAAVGINGVTVHSAFRLTISKQAGPLSNETLHTYRHLLRNVKCVIMDEVSMCSSHLFNAVNSRLQAMTAEYNLNFGGLDFFACGDLKQLPPVNAGPVYCATARSFGGRAVLWQSLDYFPLVRVMRQKDVSFSTVLTKIGSGEKLNDEEKTLIESRFKTRQWCEQNLPRQVVRLYFNNSDVEAYNASVIPTTDATHFAIATDSITGHKSKTEENEAIGIKNGMKYQETGGLPYSITLTPDYPYMLTVNADVEDGLVNGAIGKLRYVETCRVNRDNRESQRVWLDFESDYIGRMRRIKYRAHVRSKPHILSEAWVPIEMRSANIKVKLQVKCRRLQFPLVPACALTVHKSQGGTFEQIVYDYQKKHKQQLVYVALSRVTNLDGLYLTNEADDFTFYHAQGSSSSTILEVRNEYKRLENHRLETITKKMTEFLRVPENAHTQLVIANVNVQSLPAHAEDVATDSLLSQADILLLTETWMNTTTRPENLNGFQIIHSSPCDQRAGGVAIYARNLSTTTTRVRMTPCAVPTAENSTHTADIAMIQVSMPDNKKFILVAIYVHQHATYANLQRLLATALTDYSDFTPCGDHSTPILLMGDFNTNDADREKLQIFLSDHLNLRLNNDVREKTTLGRTCIDLTFSRHLDVSCKPYISYFSYHRPVFNKINFT